MNPVVYDTTILVRNSEASSLIARFLTSRLLVFAFLESSCLRNIAKRQEIVLLPRAQLFPATERKNCIFQYSSSASRSGGKQFSQFTRIRRNTVVCVSSAKSKSSRVLSFHFRYTGIRDNDDHTVISSCRYTFHKISLLFITNDVMIMPQECTLPHISLVNYVTGIWTFCKV